jgi:hypothetical protein
LNANTPPPPTPKPWQSKGDPIVTFWTDDGKVYGSQHAQLSVYCPDPDRLEVTVPPHGVIVITGPAALVLLDLLCSHRASMIRRGSFEDLEITSVTLISEETAAAEKAMRAQAETDEFNL